MMGGTLKSKMCCGCEFWEILDHMGELVPRFEPCKKHIGIRERQLEGENERMRKELESIAGRGITLDVKKYTGGDAVAMRILARAALKESVSHPTKQEGNDEEVK